MGMLFQWLRSLLFVLIMYLAMLIMGVAFLPWALVSSNGAHRACKTYTGFVRFTARHIAGLSSEVRGTVPTGECLIAAKHQSFFDIILIVDTVPRPKFIMKASLKYVPIIGWYALRIGCVPVNRGKRAQAIQQMRAGVAKGLTEPGQLIIFPQGTRVAAGATLPYKIGVGVLYGELDQTCVPVATNVGVFWPRQGLFRKPGLAVVEYLEPIVAGLTIQDFMPRIEEQIETNSNRLMREAGFELQSSS